MPDKKSYKKLRDFIAFIYFVVPIALLTTLLIFAGLEVLAEWWFRLTYAIFAGCWGLSMRGIFLRIRSEYDNPLPFYISLYPLVLVMNGLFIFVLLSLFRPFDKGLYFAAALSLGMYLGFFCHPEFWIVHRLVEKLTDKALGDLP
jgi:hypothetical protein